MVTKTKNVPVNTLVTNKLLQQPVVCIEDGDVSTNTCLQLAEW